MKHNFLKMALLAACLSAMLVPVTTFAQNTPVAPGLAAAEKAAKALAPPGWKAPRTPDGQPDLQGYYTNISTTPMGASQNLCRKGILR